MYSMFALSISTQLSLFKIKLGTMIHDHYVRTDEIETFYDWLIVNAVDRLVKVKYGIGVQGHYRHDTYEMVYESDFGMQFEALLAQQFQAHNVEFNSRMQVKVMVLGDTLLIGRTISTAMFLGV